MSRPTSSLKYPRNGIHWRNQQHAERLAADKFIKDISMSYQTLPARLLEKARNQQTVDNIDSYLAKRRLERVAA